MDVTEARRNEIKQILQSEEYGFLPPAPLGVTAETETKNERFCAGKAVLESIALTAETPDGTVRFPFKFCYRKGETGQKCVVMLNFRPDVPDRYLPAEEIIDQGWAFVSLDYQSVTADNADADENAAVLGKNGCGKIAMWAWAAMRVLDHLLTRPECDPGKIGVAGHSRLGKTALVAAAFDERFAFAHSNCSGTCGAALFSLRDECSESIEAITRRFPYWFCSAFRNYADKEDKMPFDQDLLLSLIAPRGLSVGSAEEDLWANPSAEKAAVEKVRPLWEGRQEALLYGVRPGLHYFSRADWNRFLPFFAALLDRDETGSRGEA